MMKRLTLALAIAGLSVVAYAAPPANISQTVGVCDPNYPQRCAAITAGGAMPISGSITATNPSVGTTGATAPTSATEVGYINGSGNLTAASTANPLPVTATFSPSGTQDTNTKQVNGASVNVGTGAASTGTQRVTTSTDSTIGTLTTVTNPVGVKGSDGSAIASTSNPLTVGDVLAIGSTTSGEKGNLPLCATITAAPTNTTAQSNPFSCDTAGALRVSQATAANLNATVVGTGTFATQATLQASSAVVGHVIADSGSTTAVTGTVTSSATLQTQTDTVMVGGVNIKEINAVTPLMGNGATGTGALRVSIANDSTGVVQPGNTANTTPWLVQAVPGAASGLSPYVLEPTASDNHANIKNGAGLVYHLSVFNNSATVNYIRLYNAATGFNGCNSATNIAWEGNIPASTSGAGFVEDIGPGITFSTGISICVTGGYGQTNTSNATASAISVNVGYK